MSEVSQDGTQHVELAPRKDLLVNRPYPPAHFTRPAIAVRALVDGIFSKGYAADRGEALITFGRFQGEKAVCITDVERIIKEEGVEDFPRLAASVYGLTSGDASERTNIYQRGGVCLLINPNIQRYSGFVEISDAKKELISEEIRDDAQGKVEYGGGFRGEVVVGNVIQPEDISGVVLSDIFEDSNILDVFQSKVAPVDVPTDLLRLYNDEITLLRAARRISPEINDAIAAFQLQYQEAEKLAISNNPNSFYHSMKQVLGEEHPDVLPLKAEYERNQQQLENIVQGDEYKTNAEKIKNALSLRLPEVLKELGVETYRDLILRFATEAHVPVYDKTGQVILS